MQDFINVLTSALQNEKSLQFAAIILGYFLLSIVVFRSESGKRMVRSIRLLFYSDSSFDSSTLARRRLIELEHQVSILRKAISSKNFEARRDAMQAEIESQLTKELPALVKSKLDELKVLDASLEPTIQAAITSAVGSYFNSFTPLDIISAQRERARLQEKRERGNILEKTIEEQMRSAGRLKAVMINLFVLFNIGVLLIYLFAASTLSDRAVTAIIGLYVSLAAFIVYIYRSSNFRSSVLLALREDAKKYFDADDYLRRLKLGASPTDRDIEVLKLLMLNRSEREKMADHPYELILKGVSNSNIQFKGGKIIPSSKSEK